MEWRRTRGCRRKVRGRGLRGTIHVEAVDEDGQEGAG